MKLLKNTNDPVKASLNLIITRIVRSSCLFHHSILKNSLAHAPWSVGDAHLRILFRQTPYLRNEGSRNWSVHKNLSGVWHWHRHNLKKNYLYNHYGHFDHHSSKKRHGYTNTTDSYEDVDIHCVKTFSILPGPNGRFHWYSYWKIPAN